MFDPTEPFAQGIATRAAQWGWDQREPEIQAAADAELEACVQTLKDLGWHNTAADLRAARRPKPPSLKKQALAILAGVAVHELYGGATTDNRLSADDMITIRRALEALPE
ncbi:MAG: hypothetical protein EBT15_12285 [Betaproteobacteria bacterium]|nr:hypothetical protein [Betaproteobacteria bacterium]